MVDEVLVDWWSLLGLDPRGGSRGRIFFLGLFTVCDDEDCSSLLSPSEERGTCVLDSAGWSGCDGEVATGCCWGDSTSS